MGCSPWHRKESDMTKGLTLSPKDTTVFVPQVSVLLLRVFTSRNRSAWQSAHPWSAAPELREGLTSGLSRVHCPQPTVIDQLSIHVARVP